MSQLTPFCSFKTFHDRTYYVLTEHLEKILLIWSNLFNPRDHTIREIYYTPDKLNDSKVKINTIIRFLHRSLYFMEMAQIVKIPSVVMGERPENYRIVISLIQILSELVNGSNLHSQAMIYGYNLDVYLSLVNRIVDDINSPFYKMKLESIYYFKYLSDDIPKDSNVILKDVLRGDNISGEELKSRISTIISTNLSPTNLEKIITRLIKKLFIYTKSRRSAKFKDQLISTIKQSIINKNKQKEKEKEDLIKQQEQSKLSKNKLDLYEVESSGLVAIDSEIRILQQKLNKLNDLSTSISEFEDKEAIILQEMEDIIQINSYKSLIEYYKLYNEFNSHIILTICSELLGMMDIMARKSDSFRANVAKRVKMMYMYFGNEVPTDVLQENRIDVTRISRKDESEAPEDIVIFMFMVKIINKIEVMEKNGVELNNKTIQFIQHPLSFYLSQETKESFLDSVVPSKMIETVAEDHETFVIEMEHSWRNRKSSAFFYYISLHDNLTKQRYFVWYLCLLQNLALAYSLRTNDETGGVDYEIFKENTFKISGIVIGSYSFILLLLWFLGRYRQIVDINKERLMRVNGGSEKLSVSEWIDIYIIDSFINNNTSIQLILHTLFGFLGAFIDPFVHTLQLLLIILMSQTAGYVVRSITKNIRQLGITFILALFIIYSYSFIIFINYKDKWDGQTNDNGDFKMCYNLWDCVIYSTNLGFRNGGGISDSMAVDPTEEKGSFIVKFIFDLSFFVFINIISLNIIFGIIIDTFAAMRDALQERSNLYIIIRR